MDIRTFSLDPDLTVAEVGAGTADAWHFLPMDDRRAELFALDARYILATGRAARSMSVAIFDRIERRRTNIETNALLAVHTGRDHVRTWCYSPAHCSVFILECVRKPDRTYPNPWQYLRQLSVDGSVNRRFRIAEGFHASALVARADGRILCIDLNRVAAVDPATGDVRLSTADLVPRRHPAMSAPLQWFSPDGRWALRAHGGPIVAAAKRRPGGWSGALLSRLLPGREAAANEEPDHPDLVADDVPRVGRAVDLVRLDPIGVERRLILRYDEVPADALPALEALREQRDEAAARAQFDWLCGLSQYAEELRWADWLYRWIDAVEWDADGQGFTVAWLAGRRKVPASHGARYAVTVVDFARRHVSLDGVVGPVVHVRGEPKPFPLRASAMAIAAVKAEVRERSRHVVDCAGSTGEGVAATLRAIRATIEETSLDRLVFGGMLQFRVRVGGRLVGEKKFFDMARTLPPDQVAAFLPELRQLLESYGKAARAYLAAGNPSITSGPSDRASAALSEAALTLATLDDAGFDALRDWVVTVDQEHDSFAAAKVFPAVARRTGFATTEAVRFGLWFFLQQWQTVAYEKTWLGLFKAAPAVMPAAAFAAAAFEEAQAVRGFSKETTLEVGLSNVKAMLGRTLWDRSVSAELDRLMAAANS